MINSIWAGQTAPPTFPSLEGEYRTDVLIVGGGMAGLLCAHRLASAGVDYLLVEADRICGGITRNTTAKITSQHGLIYHQLIRRFDVDTARLYWQANQAALTEYRRLAEGLDCDFEEKDNYIYSTVSPKKLEKELAALERIGARADFADKLSIPVAAVGAVRFPNQAQIDPIKFISQLVKGLNIRENTPVRAFQGNTALLDRGRVTAEKIIVTTHFPIINKHGGYFLKMYQDRSYVLALEDGPSVDGMYLDEAKDGFSFRNAGPYLLLGGGGHRTGKQGDGWTQLDAFAKHSYPGTAVACRWAAQDCMTLDGVPYIGRYSRGTPELYVATGFNKWGMTSSMAAAMVLTDLVRERESPYGAVFDPSRTVLRPQLFANIGAAAAHLLTFSTPRCPHMGCALRWNQWERSWDCPCHGSRFSETGRLLDGPATGDMRKKDRGSS